ncbi:hypothetical protein UlMin_042423 [Ulmus minor]
MRKTTFVKRHLTGEFEKKYEHEFTPWTSLPTMGKSTFTARQEKFGGLRDGYIHGQCAIIIFDVTARLTYKNVPNWHRDLCSEAKQVTFHRKNNLHYYEILAKSNYNFDKPFLYLARKLDANLHFLESPALALSKESAEFSKFIACPEA